MALAAIVLIAVPAARAGHPSELTSPRPTTSPPPAPLAAAVPSAGPITNPEPPLEPVPEAECGPGAWPETGMQGRVSREDHENGLAARGFRCNTELVGKHIKEDGVGSVGGYKVLRYVDEAGNECAYYDTSLLPPTNAPDGNLGVRVLDMADPHEPKLSIILASTAMSFPHESLILNEKRGVLAAVAGNLSQAVLPGIVDIYDISQDCRLPLLMSSTPLGIWGHESGMAPDGKTFYSASFSTGTIVALDISNLLAPVPVWVGEYDSHGLSLSEDGTRAYVAKNSNFGDLGLGILDTSEIQARVPNPDVPEISLLQWESLSIPQNTVPITIDGHPYVIESDEFGAQVETGAARIIDIADETQPRVIANLRLEVHQQENFPELAGDPGVDTPFQFAQGYTSHFCNVPSRVDPPIVACGMSVSGLRVFDIRDPHNPREIAYYNAPVLERVFPEGSNWAYSQPAFAPERNEIWFSDAYTGFYAVRLTNGAWPGNRELRRCGKHAARVVNGSSAAEPLVGSKARDAISGRGGGDRIHGRGSGDCLRGGDGDDGVKGGAGNDRARGGGADDFVRGGSGRDRLSGSNGDDRVNGAKGDDFIRGGRGDDALDGGRGDDVLRGGSGDDSLIGGPGSDRLVCGDGEDVAVPGPGDRVHRSCETVR